MTPDFHRRSLLRTCLVILSAAALIFGQAPEKKAAPAAEKDRGQVLAEIAGARTDFGRDPRRGEVRLRLARLLYQAGDFKESLSVLQPLLKMREITTDALLLATDLDYLSGRYGSAENTLQKIMARNPQDRTVQVKTRVKLMFIYYQTNRYEKAAGLFKGMEGQIKLPLLDLMKAFGQERPLLAVWPSGIRQTAIPFTVTDPLPIISVELQGRPIYALIDTGADTFVLDSEIAGSMGIKGLTSMTGTFAGGKKAEVGFAKAGSLKIGEVTLRSVPVSILPTQRFSKGFAEGKYTIGGIVGTGILKQFLATLDYPHSRLILRRPDGQSLEEFQREISNSPAVEVPFVLALSHFMMVRGRLNDREPLTFFVDSGLASEAAFAGPVETLKFAGIPVPETKIEEGNIGGGGGAGFATGMFPIKKLGLGSLVQDDKKGEFGSFPPGSLWMLGFINDGMISHQFLRQYAWTIDFSGMRMIFVRKPACSGQAW
jgi:hypothetical protein